MAQPPAQICPDNPVDFAEDLKDRVTVPLGGLEAAPVASTPAAGVAGAGAPSAKPAAL